MFLEGRNSKIPPNRNRIMYDLLFNSFPYLLVLVVLLSNLLQYDIDLENMVLGLSNVDFLSR